MASPLEVARAEHGGAAVPDVGLVAFARLRRRILSRLFFIVVALVTALLVSDFVGLIHLEESGGWLLFIASLPWSILAIAMPVLGAFGIAIVVAGLGINAVAVTAITWWWFETLRKGLDA